MFDAFWRWWMCEGNPAKYPKPQSPVIMWVDEENDFKSLRNSFMLSSSGLETKREFTLSNEITNISSINLKANVFPKELMDRERKRIGEEFSLFYSAEFTPLAKGPHRPPLPGEPGHFNNDK